MIIDTIANASKYFSVHPLFAKAFEYIKQTDLLNKESGKYEIDGDKLKAIFSNKKGMTAEESIAKFECHNKHIDIQLCISGVETIGWKPREKCSMKNGGYNEEKDVQFYRCAGYVFSIDRWTICNFFSGRCTCADDRRKEIKKLVIKVKI